MNQDNQNGMDQREAASGNAMPENAEQRIREDAAAVAETAKTELSNIKSEAEAEIGALAEEGQRRVGEMADEAKGYANDQKDMLADQLGSVAKALHKAAGELEQENATTAGYAHRIAEGIDRLTKDVKSRDVDGLVGMAEDFGRKQPAAFLAVSALAGFAASRFLKASAERRTPAAPSAPQSSSSYTPTSPAYGGTTGTPAPDTQIGRH